MITLTLLLALLSSPQENQQEHPKVPKDSIMLVVTGCLKGRVLAVSDVRQEDTQSGPIVKAKSFRVAGKKEIMKDVKEHDGHLVDVTGIVKKSSLIEPGIKVGKSVTIGGGPPVAGSGAGAAPVPNEYIPVIDAESVRMRATNCGGGG
jgi:hypothetical protein